jgi:hypothetical protein
VIGIVGERHEGQRNLKRDDARQAGALYTTHSRTVNDVIQYVLYHRAIGCPPDQLGAP